MSPAPGQRPIPASARLLLSLVALTALAHGLALLAPLQFDDEHQILLNPAMRDPASIPRFFIDPWIGSSLGYLRFYRPVLFITFVIDGVIGGGSAVPYRVTSLALLVVFALLARQFVRRVLPRILPNASPKRVEDTAALTALLAVVHPLMNESLLLATGRSSLLMAVFGLGALTLLASPRLSPLRALAVLTLAVLAFLTKETAVVLGVLAPMVTWVCHAGKGRLGRLLAAWPVVLPVALFASFLLALPHLPEVFPEPPSTAPPSTVQPMAHADRPAVAGVALLGFCRLFLFPWGLSLVHEVPVPPGWKRFAASLVWPCLAAVVWILWRREGPARLVASALLWFAAALAPILLAGLNTPMGEHRVVLAMTAPLAALAYGLRSIHSGAFRTATTLVFIGSLTLMAAHQSWPWRSPRTLWTHETTLYPQHARAWARLSKALSEEGELDGAANAIERAMTLAPNVPGIMGRAALLEMDRGRPHAAAILAWRVVAIDDSFADMHLILAQDLAQRGDLVTALAHARRAVELWPESSPAWNAVGNVLLMLGDPGAAEAYRKALALDPSNREAAVNLENALRGAEPGRQ